MGILRVILGDQLSCSLSSLEHCDKNADLIMMSEVIDEATYVKHHQKKLVYVFSAMRHFAQDLIQKDYNVSYTKLEAINNSGSLTSEVERAIRNNNINKIIITEPGEYRVLQYIRSWENKFGVKVEILKDTRFLCSIDNFEKWARPRKQLRMEYFYREIRKKYSVLMHDNSPIGNKWNFDSQNSNTINKKVDIPRLLNFTKDQITLDVIKVVSEKFNDHFGDIEPFNLAVTRRDAVKSLKEFIENKLIKFGDYQDAMLENEPVLYHSYLSFYLNSGLLLPIECVRAAERAYHQGKAPLNAVEGFIRQIIGWREYVRGIYWLKMPDYKNENFLMSNRKLPSLYWDTKTDMNCLHQCVKETKNNAYAHHIQRLMVLGNFALLIGVSPKEMNEWFLIVYADAYEWVELPNVSGMVLFADGGLLASKPYASSGSYINKMSNYCKNCKYKVSVKNGSEACPFNYLYWNFLVKNKDKLSNNNRLAMIYSSYNKMDENKKLAIEQDSDLFLSSLK